MKKNILVKRSLLNLKKISWEQQKILPPSPRISNGRPFLVGKYCATYIIHYSLRWGHFTLDCFSHNTNGSPPITWTNR